MSSMEPVTAAGNIIEAKKEAIGEDLDLTKVEPIKVDFPPDQFQYAVSIAQEALSEEKTLREVAHTLKRKFDEKYEPLWHCVVGRNFGSYMSHGIPALMHDSPFLFRAWRHGLFLH